MSDETSKPKEDTPLNEDDIKKLNEDIKKTQDELVSKQTKEVIEQEKKKAKEEAIKEIEVKKLMEDKEKENQDLKQKLEEQEKKSAEQIGQIQKKVDDMVSSKNPTSGKNPFDTDPNKTIDGVDKWSKEKIDNVEEASARAFFGVAYDDRT